MFLMKPVHHFSWQFWEPPDSIVIVFVPNFDVGKNVNVADHDLFQGSLDQKVPNFDERPVRLGFDGTAQTARPSAADEVPTGAMA
jgi:hypothetical protein